MLAGELQGLLDLQFDDIGLTGFSLAEIELVLDDAADRKARAKEPAAEDALPADSLQGPAVSRAGRSVAPRAAPPPLWRTRSAVLRRHCPAMAAIHREGRAA